MLIQNEITLMFAKSGLDLIRISRVTSYGNEWPRLIWPTLYVVTRWSGSSGIEAWSRLPTGFLQCFDAIGWVIWPVKIVPQMTYNVSSGTLSLYSLIRPHQMNNMHDTAHCDRWSRSAVSLCLSVWLSRGCSVEQKQLNGSRSYLSSHFSTKVEQLFLCIPTT